MAKVTSSASVSKHDVIKKKRKGIHAKSKTSSLKTSKNYVKAYAGQGR